MKGIEDTLLVAVLDVLCMYIQLDGHRSGLLPSAVFRASWSRSIGNIGSSSQITAHHVGPRRKGFCEVMQSMRLMQD